MITASRLLEWLRERLDAPDLRFEAEPERLHSGVESRVYRLRVAGAEALGSALILRLFEPHEDPRRGALEAAVQNAVADLGYPAPRALVACSDPAPLGGVFVVMECLPGAPLLDLTGFRVWSLAARALRAPRLVADLQLRLHRLPLPPVVRAIEGAGFREREFAVPGHLDRLAARIRNARLDGLEEALAWLDAHAHSAVGEGVLCHGDLWPGNVLVERGHLQGVIDWSLHGMTLAPREYDVAVSWIGLRCGRVDLAPVLQAVAGPFQRALADRLRRAYERATPLEPERLRYFALLRCVESLSWVGARRRGVRDVLRTSDTPDPWDLPGSTAGFAGYFRAETGIAPTLPPPG